MGLRVTGVTQVNIVSTAHPNPPNPPQPPSQLLSQVVVRVQLWISKPEPNNGDVPAGGICDSGAPLLGYGEGSGPALLSGEGSGPGVPALCMPFRCGKAGPEKHLREHPDTGSRASSGCTGRRESTLHADGDEEERPTLPRRVHGAGPYHME
ncbi:hypothetical protein EYF80_046759 [Liparis tanakae]|uniref:Uncharacterized protein n=1 Tax=Liparis tanakae TaxID=230148 RepID=A0A4Z2FPI7_9TELE|nr:hypothetical protein EYF80_046759 [Liparis tanakae]